MPGEILEQKQISQYITDVASIDWSDGSISEAITYPQRKLEVTKTGAFNVERCQNKLRRKIVHYWF